MWNISQLFRQHAREIDRFLRRRGHPPETAADLTQDTFVRALNATPSDDRHPRAYLHQIARNLSVDFARRNRIVEYVSLPDEDMHRIADPSPSPETVVYDRQRLAVIERALDELPEKTRRAFEMHRLGGKRLCDVAEELDLSVSRTWQLVRQAYLHLRERLKEEEKTSRPSKQPAQK